MSDTAAETATTETSTSTDAATETAETFDWKAEAEKWQALAKKNESRAKANAEAAKELEQVRQQSMSDTEKAVAQAKLDGRAEAMALVGAKLASAEIRAAAAGRLTAEQLETLTEGLNYAVFLDEEGDVDAKKVARFVDGIAPAKAEDNPAPAPVFPDLGQGARGSASSTMALNGDPLLKAVQDKLQH